jgi:hypothetical protein
MSLTPPPLRSGSGNHFSHGGHGGERSRRSRSPHTPPHTPHPSRSAFPVSCVRGTGRGLASKKALARVNRVLRACVARRLRGRPR